MKQPRSEQKDSMVAMVFWCLSLGGWLGLHRFYLNKPGTAILWFFTFGLFGFGALYDLFALPGMVRDFNLKNGYAPVALPAAPPLPQPGYGVAPALPTSREVIIREIIKIPCRYCGNFVDHTEPKCPGCGAPLMQYR